MQTVVRLLIATSVLFGVAGGAVGQPGSDLFAAFSAFFHTKDVRIDNVPDLYPGGYARISVYAKKANLSGLVADEVWIRLVGVTLDVAALRAGTLRITDTRDTALYARSSLKSLEEYFLAGNAFKDIRLWSEEGYLFGEGTIPYDGRPVKVWLKGFFAVGGISEVYFYLDNMRLNGLPVPTFVIRKLESDMNPVLTQRTWPVTFKIRSLLMTKDVFVISSQADPSAPCAYCSSGDAPTVNP